MKDILTLPTRHRLTARLDVNVGEGATKVLSWINRGVSDRVEIGLITLRQLRLDAPLAAHCARHFHNSWSVHALHSIPGQRTLYRTGICKPTNLYPWGQPLAQ